MGKLIVIWVRFKHIVDLSDRLTKHNLAYIQLYQPATSSKTRYYFSINDDEKTCNVKLWEPDFYPESRDCIIPVHNILSQFVPVKYKISSQNNAVEYLAINQINHKLHIR